LSKNDATDSSQLDSSLQKGEEIIYFGKRQILFVKKIDKRLYVLFRLEVLLVRPISLK